MSFHSKPPVLAEMAETSATIDPRSGFCSKTQTFHSLRPPPPPLPHQTLPLSFPSFAFSLLPSPLPSNPAFADSATGLSLSYPAFISHVSSLSHNLQSQFHLSKGDAAFIISPSRLDIPVIYYALLSIGAVVSPANPLSSPSEISRQLDLVSPSIIFATSATAPKLPPTISATIVLVDSAGFCSLFNPSNSPPALPLIDQSDAAAVLFSSGTTGAVKGVVLTHRNLIAAAALAGGAVGTVMMVTVPLFHVFGFVFAVKGAAAGETAVLMTDRFVAGRVIGTVERFRVNILIVAPPALLKIVMECEEGGIGDGVDLSSLQRVGCGGAPLGVELIRRFLEKFPNVTLSQGYGLTESTTGIFRAVGPEETRCIGSTGRLLFGCEAKIVNPSTGIALHPCQQGELWVRGPTIMKEYIGDKEATCTTLNSEGWLKTGDLCYIDYDGFLFVVDRLKELIKYKGYQVPPAELEHLLQTHPDVIEAAVIPYPDNEAGQVPMAFIVRQPNSTLGKSEIMEFVAKQVAPYKKIRRVSFVNSIPKNPSGKILRKDLVKLTMSEVNPKL